MTESLGTHRRPRVVVRTLGCKVNRAESETLSEVLIAAGVDIAADEVGTDVVVINTCTVTSEADAKVRKAVRHALGAPGEPVVVVTGCLAALDAESLRVLGGRVVVEPDKAKVEEVVLEALADTLCNSRLTPVAPMAPSTFRTRVNIKVQDGCDHRCTYCIVPDARGDPTSVRSSDVVGRIASLAASETKEVVLTGVNIGRYGDGPVDLAALIEMVAATGIARVRLSSIEPTDLTPRLLKSLADQASVMPHLHVPLQSGCDRTLDAMGRGHDAASYADALARARAAIPGLAVTTDVMVGFPGESDEEFAESIAFVGSCGFARLHVFRYSRRVGTPAAMMGDQVPPDVSAARAHRMRALGERSASRRAAERVGERARVLVERVTEGSVFGTSEDYLRVTVRLASGQSPRHGEIVVAELTAAQRGGAWGRIL